MIPVTRFGYNFNAAARFDIYPNPTTESFRITPTEESGSVKLYVELTDFNGTVLQKTAVDAGGLEIGSTLPKGLNVLKVIHGDQTTTHRLVKR